MTEPTRRKTDKPENTKLTFDMKVPLVTIVLLAISAVAAWTRLNDANADIEKKLVEHDRQLELIQRLDMRLGRIETREDMMGQQINRIDTYIQRNSALKGDK